MATAKTTVVKRLLKNNFYLSVGDLVEAKLIERKAKTVYFDIGKFGIGVIYGIEANNAQEALRALKAGDAVLAKIKELENENGYIELSLSEIDKQKTFQELKELMENGDLVTTKITGANNGGLIAEYNNQKGFIPVSQLSATHMPKVEAKEQLLEEFKKFVGQEFKVKVMDVNPRTKRIVFSERESLDENLKSEVSKYKVGDIIEGIVSSVADFGAFIKFVDNPKIEGLIHISELDHSLVDNPKDIIKINDVLKLKIIDINNGKIALSWKALKPNPWETILDVLKPGQEVEGVVSKFHPFGAFIKLPNGLFGLIHISEFGSIDEMKKKIDQGKAYQFRIDTVKPEEKRIILKLAVK